MKAGAILFWCATILCGGAGPLPVAEAPVKKVYILPIRDDIMPPLVYLVRRGVKEAMEAKADLLLLDMETDGGRVDTTDKIIRILDKFKGRTATYVNKRAFSAGAFIAVSTKKIYMAPQSYIGAAAPIMISPGGGGVEKTPDTYEAKMTSAVAAMVRAQAEKNGHNIDVVQAMIDKTKKLEIDGEVLNKEGNILTLTDRQAAKEYGNPPKPLLSSGSVESLDEVLDKLGCGNAERHYVQPTGAEKFGTWIEMISPLLLMIGVIGLYIEFKTPGFGLPGIVALIAFAIYFLGGYVAGLSGMEWLAVFVLGLLLIGVEIFVFPGTIALGVVGACLMLVALVMALADVYPSSAPGLPSLPGLPALTLPLRTLGIASIGSVVAILVLARFLPKTPLYQALVSQSASGVTSVAEVEQRHAALIGQAGVTISALRPGGKAQFGDRILDVISQGDMVPKGTRVQIIGYSGREAIVEAVS